MTIGNGGKSNCPAYSCGWYRPHYATKGDDAHFLKRGTDVSTLINPHTMKSPRKSKWSRIELGNDGLRNREFSQSILFD
jgi:hypothetical protein